MLLKRVVIGSSVESIVYAFFSDSYFLPTSSFGPIFYDTLDVRVLGSERSDHAWSRMQTILSLSGKLLNYREIDKIKIIGSALSIFSADGYYKYDFETCKVFDTTRVILENEIEEYLPPLYKVYDDFELSNLGGKHGYLNPKNVDESFASRINYYVSERVDGADYITDCVVESDLEKRHLSDFNFSDSMTRFAVIRHLTSIGIHGTFMNMYKNGTPKYRKPKVTHKKRIIAKRERTRYKDSENVKLLNLSLKEIVDAFSTERS